MASTWDVDDLDGHAGDVPVGPGAALGLDWNNDVALFFFALVAFVVAAALITTLCDSMLFRNIKTLEDPPRMKRADDYDEAKTAADVDHEGPIMGCMPFNCPTARSGCCMAAEESTRMIFTYGGVSETGEVLPGLWLHSPADLEWSVIEAEDPQGPAAYASLVCHGEHLYLFGGLNNENRCSGSLRIFTPSDQPEWKLVKLQISPPARFNSSLVYWGENKFVLFGGHSHGTALLNDVWVLYANGEESEWEQIIPQQDSHDAIFCTPMPREAHSSAVVGDKLFVFGGSAANKGRVTPPRVIEAFALKTKRWQLLAATGAGPYEEDQLIGGSAHVLGDTGNVLVIGSELVGLFNSMYILETATVPIKWNSVTPTWASDWTLVPGLRLFAGSCYMKSTGTIFVFGGSDDYSNESPQGTLVMISFPALTGLLNGVNDDRGRPNALGVDASETLDEPQGFKVSGAVETKGEDDKYLVRSSVSMLPLRKRGTP